MFEKMGTEQLTTRCTECSMASATAIQVMLSVAFFIVMLSVILTVIFLNFIMLIVIIAKCHGAT
jgi:hypothetical protein